MYCTECMMGSYCTSIKVQRRGEMYLQDTLTSARLLEPTLLTLPYLTLPKVGTTEPSQLSICTNLMRKTV
jgi:hypothetical protein